MVMVVVLTLAVGGYIAGRSEAPSGGPTVEAGDTAVVPEDVVEAPPEDAAATTPVPGPDAATSSSPTADAGQATGATTDYTTGATAGSAAGGSTPTAQADEKPPAVAPSPPPDSPEGQSLRSRTGPVCLTGLFATVFGGPGQVYFLTEDSGRQTQILLDEKVAAPVGGPLALDRQRVTIRGEAAGVTGAGDPLVRATSVSLGGGCG